MSVQSKMPSSQSTTTRKHDTLKTSRTTALENFNQEQSINMLPKAECKKAIQNWEQKKTSYPEVKKLINPQSVFSFNKQECNWLNKYNANFYFHFYIGVFESKLVSIIVPIGKDGKETNLKAYLYSNLTPLKSNLNLVEEIIIKKITRTNLSTSLLVLNSSEELELPTKNEPLISINKSMTSIELWNHICLDWFYDETEKFSGKRIFKSFRVPLADLAKNIEDSTKVYVLFGLKNSLLYNRLIPVLIFVANNENKEKAEILSSENNSSFSNAADFDRPCPPFCNSESDFTLFN